MAKTTEPVAVGQSDKPGFNWKTPKVAALAAVALAGVFAIGAVAGQSHRLAGIHLAGRVGIMGPGMMEYQRPVSADREWYANQNRIEGVVTAVNGSILTIAGNGATNDVTTNSSTRYIGSSQPKVDDTVVVDGTISGGTFTATQIVVNP